MRGLVQPASVSSTARARSASPRSREPERVVSAVRSSSVAVSGDCPAMPCTCESVQTTNHPAKRWSTRQSLLRSAPNSSQRCKWATSSSWTICPPTKAPLPNKPSASEALGSCFCRPTARPQSHRNGFRQTQGAPARHGHAHNRRTLEDHRTNLRPLRPRRMCKLLPSHRLWISRDRPMLSIRRHVNRRDFGWDEKVIHFRLESLGNPVSGRPF